MEFIAPVTGCLQCKYHSMVYSSLFDLHFCNDCTVEVHHPYIESTVDAFSRRKKEPLVVTNLAKICCVGCGRLGGIYFRLGDILDYVYCDGCGFQLPFRYFVDAKVNAVRTKILEETYNHTFSLNRSGV